MNFEPSTNYKLRALNRARYGLNDAIDDMTNLLLDIYPEDQDWDGDPIDDIRSKLQDIDDELAAEISLLVQQGADIEGV